MNRSNQTYTYRAGKKVTLEKSPDQFVVRTSPEDLKRLGIDTTERVSPASTRVRTNSTELEGDMARARTVAPTHHAYYLADSGAEFLITDRVVVTVREGVSEAQIDDLAARHALIRQATLAPRMVVFQLTDHTGMNPVKLVVKLMEEEQAVVQTVEHDLNHRVSRYQFALPTDPMYSSQWHLHRRYAGGAFDPRCSSRCEEAWTALNDFGSAEVVVGVTDDGCRLDHPDFNGLAKFAGWGYFQGSRLVKNTDIDAVPGRMYELGSNHGTSCAGVIAGEVDAALTVGAAPGCRLLPVKWESNGPMLELSDTKLLTALNFLADKVDIVSNSWGIVPYNVWPQYVVDRIRSLAQSGGRRGKGILFLWAAGNDNSPIQHQSAQAIPYTSGWQQRADGSAVWIGVDTSRQFENNLVGSEGVMHVAALASVARRSHYSNYGTGIAICAPTNNSHKYRRSTVPGLGVVTTTGEGGGVTERFGGTSSATPLVAGVAALVISANPDLTALEVASILKRTASKDLSLEGYPRTPAASFDPNPSWDVSPVPPFDLGEFLDIRSAEGTWSPWFGHGRVDAPAAVAEALRARASGGTHVLRKRATPALAIPDNRAAGITSILYFENNAAVSNVSVLIDITHTWIGDLVVGLRSPAGIQITLHARSGGATRDLKRAYDVTTTPALGALFGGPTRGDWVLSVEDRAARDTGTLNSWELAFEARESTTVELVESPAVEIPDEEPAGIERVLECVATGRISDVKAHVDITHSYIGDLRVEVVSPNGTVVALHDRTGGAADNLITDFDAANRLDMQRFRGEPYQGAWRLRVYDLERVDVGKLNKWALSIMPGSTD